MQSSAEGVESGYLQLIMAAQFFLPDLTQLLITAQCVCWRM